MSPCLRSATSRCCSSSAAPSSIRPRSRSWALRIDGKIVERVERLAPRFVKRRMGVNGLHHSFDGGFGAHGRHGFRDQLEGFGSDNVYAQDLANFFVRDHFDESFLVAEGG